MERYTNAPYRKVQRRVNFLPPLLFLPFIKYSSSPRLMLEVFLRKNFGQFYFNIGSVLKVAIILLILPRVLFWVMYSRHERLVVYNFWDIYLGWHIFIAAFFIVSVIRWLETMRLSNDPNHPYNHPGDSILKSKKVSLFETSNEKMMAVVYEPIVCFIAGIILLNIGQPIGFLVVVNSIFYSVGNYAEFWQAEQVIKEKTYELQQARMGKEVHDAYEMDTIVRKQTPPQSTGYKEDDDSPTYVE